jgi:hypothetical protein
LASLRDDSLLGPEEEEAWTPREERRSPAAVFGSKRLGLETIPRRMEENIQSEIDSQPNLQACLIQAELITDHHPREIREAFLSTFDPPSKSRSKSRSKKYDDQGPSLALAKAATALPGDYAVMSNIMREIKGRLGDGWLSKLDGGVMEVSAGFGPGIW